MIGAIIGGATGLIQAGAGLIQSKKADKKLKNLQRPQYQIPDEVLKNVSEAERMALQGLPEEQKMQYVERMQQSGANQLSTMKSLGAGLRGLSGVQQSFQESNKELLSLDAQARRQNMLQATYQRSLLGQKKDEQWSINQYQPYMQEKNALEAQKGAGIQNMFGGLSTVGQSAMNIFAMGGFNKNKNTTSSQSNFGTMETKTADTSNLGFDVSPAQTSGLDMSNTLSLPNNQSSRALPTGIVGNVGLHNTNLASSPLSPNFPMTTSGVLYPNNYTGGTIVK